MHPLAAAVKNHVAASQSKSVECGSCRTDRKRQENPLGGQRNIGNAWEPFPRPINFQTFQFQPCQLTLDVGCSASMPDYALPSSGAAAVTISSWPTVS